VNLIVLELSRDLVSHWRLRRFGTVVGHARDIGARRCLSAT
jgi:hypothetical protein